MSTLALLRFGALMGFEICSCGPTSVHHCSLLILQISIEGTIFRSHSIEKNSRYETTFPSASLLSIHVTSITGPVYTLLAQMR